MTQKVKQELADALEMLQTIDDITGGRREVTRR